MFPISFSPVMEGENEFAARGVVVGFRHCLEQDALQVSSILIDEG